MVPRPIEGRQTPIAAMQVVGPPPSGGGNISLGRLIDFVLQRTYHELTVLAELLPRKTDMERKIEIVQFASRARQLFVRLLALVKWAASASKVEKCNAIMAFLDKQSLLFVDTADALAIMARETLVHARLPSFHIPCAVEVMTLGTYSRLPTCIRDKIVPPDPITPSEKKSTLLRLDQIIQYRLVSSDLPSQMRSLRIENGRVTFHVEHEFEVSLTLMGDGPHIPWRLLDIDILVEDKETGDGKSLVHSLQVHYIHQLIQSRLVDNPKPLHDLYNCLHSFCLSLQLEVLYSQVLRLRKERLEDFIRVEDYVAGSHLVVSYWREQIARENQEYKLCVQVDPIDSSKPLQVSHVPSLTSKDSMLADQAIKSDHLSIEKLLIHTVHVRTKHRLADLRDELKPKLGISECIISGSPAVLHIPLLQPCMQSEQMLVTVDTHTGFFLAHVPQFDPPFMDDVEEAFNKDLSKLENLISELRFWITMRRCEKTIQHLPAMASEQLSLNVPSDHPLVKFGTHKLFIKLCKHQNFYIVIHLKSKNNEIEQTYYLMTVQPQPLEDEATMDHKDDTTLETELPKSYLKVVNFLQLDTFAITHGPCTKIDVEEQGISGKRKLQIKSQPDSPIKRLKHTGYFITELAHVIAMCDEHIPFSTLTVELIKRGICHQGMQVEANGTNFVVKIVQMPPCDGCVESINALQSALLSCTIRLQGKGTRAWLVEFVFCNCPLVSQSVKEQGPRRPVYFMYDFAAGTAPQVEQMVKEMIQDWITMGYLYSVILEFAEVLKHDQHNMYNGMMDIKSFTYKKLVLGYGQNKASTVTIYWRPSEKRFHLSFGVAGQTASASNPHTIVAAQLQHEFNQHHSVASLVQVLHDTYYPLLSISKLTTAPQLGVVNSRPQVAVNTFVIIPQTSTHIRIIYRNTYCLDIQCRSEGLIAIRDGAYSVFDKGKAVEDYSSIQLLKAFLNKFVDDTASHLRRRSQSDDDNPLSPVPPLDSLDPFLSSSGQLKPGSPAQRGQEGGTTPVGAGGSAGGLRFHLPLTPPSGSNPHTPASPHTSVLSQSYGASPNPSFSLASPPSLGSQSQQPHVSPSPSMLHMQAPSPGNLFAANSPINPLHVPSPSFLPAPSPSSSSASQVPMQSPAASFMSSQGHDGGSPFPAPGGSTGNLSMSSPATGTWPGSPSMPRPSPRSLGTAQSPGSSSHPALHSPQAGSTIDHKPPGVSPATSATRVLPQRSWAAAIPTLLTHKAYDLLCSPSPLPNPSLPCGTMVDSRMSMYSPLERFLGCLFMRRNLHRVIQSDESLTFLTTTEPGVIQFKVETMQCRVSLNINTLQSLHLKLTPTAEYKDQWLGEELQILEKFFDNKVVCTPFKPNGFLAFSRILNAPVQILKNCINIMRLELFPDRSFKWSVQWCLTIPPSAPKLGPPGMSAVMIKDRMLFFLQLTRIGLNLPAGVEPQTLVVPIVYDMNSNTTQLADRRDPASLSPTAPISIIRNTLKRFSDYNPQPTECSIYPAIRELLTNLVIPI